MKSPAPDQRTREEALDSTQSFILEAPAGSGKTDLLTARFLGLLGRVSHPSQILAVTYTRKAAAEMENRITGILKRAEGSGDTAPDNPWEKVLLSLGRKALSRHQHHPLTLFNSDSLRVGTFHGFCASIVKSWPLEAQILPGVALLEDLDQETMLDAVVDQYLSNVVSGKATAAERQAYEHRLVSSNNYPAAVAEQIKQLMRRRDRLKDFPRLLSTPLTPESLRRGLESFLERFASQSLSGLCRHFSRVEEAWASLTKTLRKTGASAVATLPERVPGDRLEDIPEWKRVAAVFLTGKGTPRQRFEPRYGFPKDFGKQSCAETIRGLPAPEARLLAFVAEWPDPSKDNIGFDELKATLILTEGVSTRLQEVLRSRGMDYLELELAALRALEWTSHPSQSLIFHHEHLRHVLVDEAQDLNDAQVRILAKLTEGWEPGDGRTVFFVGDPKQSIYRFRRAEVSLFYDLSDNGLSRPGETPLPLKPLRLTANFRSRPHLIQFANRLFERVMASPRKEYDEVEFSLSEPAVEKAAAEARIQVAIFHEGNRSVRNGGSSLEREARWVATRVARLYGETPEASIAVLIPARTHLDPYVRALRDVRVPLRLMEGTPLAERPEVRHLLNLFTALVRPYDDLAWAATLRAPWFRISNQVLLGLAREQGSWSKRILSGMETSPEWRKFHDAFVEAEKSFGREPYPSTVSRLWEDLDGPRLTASRYGEGGISNGRAFFDLLRPCSGLPGEEALARLHRSLEAAYTPPDPKGIFSNISMMTIHKAKGMEFDHVFAVNLDYDPLGGGRGDQPAYRMERLPVDGGPFLVAAAADRRTGKEKLAAYLLRDLEKKRTLAEARRLFYVAITRAKESLTLTGRSKPPGGGDEEGSFKGALSSLLRIMGRGDGTFDLLVNPGAQIVPGADKKVAPLSLARPPFEAEPLPYEVKSPSKVEDETFLAVEPGSEEEEGEARARGLVIHRILETAARKEALPTTDAVSAALFAEGMSRVEAGQTAGVVLEEAERAWEEPGFRSLRERALEVHPEWPLEDFDGERTLRVGRFDLLLKTPEGWWVIDYKTGQPEGNLNLWVQDQVKRYLPQVRAYGQMVGRMLNLPEEKVRLGLLLTSIPRLVVPGGQDR